jgi:hypothetical protein
MDDKQFKSLPKRVQSIILTMRQEKCVLCKHLHHKETGDTEVTFYFEPGGKRCGPKSAALATESGFLTPNEDGLFGGNTSQTWIARI